MIISMAEMLQQAKKYEYGVAAPNVFNRETIEAAYLAAIELKAPIILDVAAVHGIYECADIARFYERRYPQVPVALNLDHGGPYEYIIQAIHAGFSSVMIDRSTLPYKDNVSEVKEIVKIAHAVGISVEAELGHVGQGYEYEETRNAGLTNPEEAAKYVSETGIDCLAVAIGTSHGVYKGTPHLDFDLLETIKREVTIPLVLHGGSGTGDDNLAKAVKAGIQKVNLNTDISKAGQAALKDALNGTVEFALDKNATGEFAPKKLNLQQTIALGVEGYKKELMRYMKLFDSCNRW
jgi:fructose-bisphosphate aldolase class II